MCEREAGVTSDRVRLLYSGQMLMDTQKISDKNVVADSVLQVMIRPVD